ncbi:ATPase, AAA-type, core, P-loop containing nucleoside triphosphate hydrolase [Tanacetum coccineum]
MIVSLFFEARVSSPSIIYIEGIEVITSTGVSQILYQMESCENDEAAIVVIGTADNVITLVKDIKDEFDMLVHLGKLDMVSRSKMVDGLMKDYVVLEDRDKICNYIASGTSGTVWKNIKAICNECCAHVIEERETAISVCSWVTFEDVTKTLKDTKYGKSMLEEKDATGKEDGTIVVSSCIALVVASTSSFGYNHNFNSTSAHWASLLSFVNLNVLVFLVMQGTNRQMKILFYKTNIKTIVNGSRIHIKSKKRSQREEEEDREEEARDDTLKEKMKTWMMKEEKENTRKNLRRGRRSVVRNRQGVKLS